jgi:hypothetical protein
LTATFAEQLRRPCFRVDLRAKPANQWVDEILAWLERGGFKILNVAGPRSSKDPAIYDKACSVTTGPDQCDRRTLGRQRRDHLEDSLAPASI